MIDKIGDVSHEVITQNDIILKLINMVDERDTVLTNIYKPQIFTTGHCKYCKNHMLDEYFFQDPLSTEGVKFCYCPHCGKEL